MHHTFKRDSHGEIPVYNVWKMRDQHQLIDSIGDLFEQNLQVEIEKVIWTIFWKGKVILNWESEHINNVNDFYKNIITLDIISFFISDMNFPIVLYLIASILNVSFNVSSLPVNGQINLYANANFQGHGVEVDELIIELSHLGADENALNI